MQVVINTQKAIYSSLAADTALGALVTGIYDFVPEDAVLPYITIGNAALTDRSNIGKNIYNLEFKIKAYDNSSGRKNILAIAERVLNLLDGLPLAITSYTHYSTRLGSQQADFAADGSEFVLEADYKVTVGQ